ncbi:MAG TPA: hydroxymethylpyrimidine/phosphomethylpyrimidine kinase [Pararhizobium sp.]|uniref:hydroxymethylpyrimidine/phosphomethylpyrimidine kinase n=1 Tax=Pararhizobium sp. TaxID=1977563 RepID=UPI002CC28532|nr:hydroxymethylpyrimidine/phosphomethylpyrimidine kinase [Pararhizobium sp.]HTO32384.1 hydroxymethylpyrimidine/phosphomethylpyrimidine kinase [Pararhizobium sp.]
MAMRPHVLVVAGSDSSGGAGIVRDIETLAAFGVKASVAITAVTVQTHAGVGHVDAVAPDIVAAQMRASLAANTVAAIKIGMLATSDTVWAVSSVLEDRPDIPVVLDPVLVSTSGAALLPPDAKPGLLALFRQCALVTPNLPELSWLASGLSEGALIQAGDLIQSGARAVLVKGGHGTGEQSIDILLRPGHPAHSFASPRLAVTMRGTGCMLASAVAARLAHGDELAAAIDGAKAYVHGELVDEILHRT